MKSRIAPVPAWIITAVAVFTIVSPYVADWNVTHIYNPLWPPHAKFHNAQTMILGTLLGLAALFFVWRGTADPASNLLTALMFASFYWISQTASLTFPATALLDPEFDLPASYVAGVIPGNLFADLIILPLLAFAAWIGFAKTDAAHSNAPQ